MSIKVLLVGPVPPPHGGISVHVAELHRQLAAAGIACEVLDARQAVRGTALLRYAWHGWTIHLHTNGHNWKSWMLSLLCGLASEGEGGCVLTLHSGMAPAYLASARWKRTLARVVCAFYNRVVCVSAAIGDALPHSRTEILPASLPVRCADAPLDIRLLAWMETHRPLLSTALFFRPEYGFDVLLAALERLRQRHPTLGCIVMGSGQPPAGMDHNVLLVGDVDHGTCLTLIFRSDAFVRPTREDGDSISVREALSLGVPVVASRVGTRPEGVTLFRSGDAGDLAEKVELALSNRCGVPAPVQDCLGRLIEIYEEAHRKTGRYDAARAGA